MVRLDLRGPPVVIGQDLPRIRIVQLPGHHDTGITVTLAQLAQIPAQHVVPGVTAVAPADGIGLVRPVLAEALALVRLPVPAPLDGEPRQLRPGLDRPGRKPHPDERHPRDLLLPGVLTPPTSSTAATASTPPERSLMGRP